MLKRRKEKKIRKQSKTTTIMEIKQKKKVKNEKVKTLILILTDCDHNERINCTFLVYFVHIDYD